MSAINRRESEGVRASFVPDAVFVDHRPARFGAVSCRRFPRTGAVDTLFAMSDTTTFRIVEVPKASGMVMLWRAAEHPAIRPT